MSSTTSSSETGLNQEESVERRRKAILREAEARGFETVVFVNEVVNQNPSNFVYVCPGGLGDEHQTLALNVKGDVVLVTPHWGARAAEESGMYTKVVAVRQEKGHHARGTAVVLTGFNPAKVCFDASTMSAQFSYLLSETLHTPINAKVDISDHVFALRSLKDEYEVGEIRKAIGITEKAVAEMIEAARPGADTWTLKKRMDARMIELGAVDRSFDSTISFCRGPRRPPGEIKAGDILCCDVGAKVPSGYCSDMGRTWSVGAPSAETRGFLERIARAQVEGFENIREDVSGNEVLRKANAINERLGFDGALRSGHQIGLDVHDYTMPFAPNFGPIETDALPLRAGMTLTYEPTRVDPRLGLRSHIEDIVHVTKGGAEVLNEMPYLLG